MSMSLDETGAILEQVVFPIQGMTKAQKDEQVAVFQVTCGNLNTDVFTQACIRAVRGNKTQGWIKPGHVYNHAVAFMEEREMNSQPSQKPAEPESPEAIRGWCLQKIDKLSPKYCKQLADEIDDNNSPASKLAKWDDAVLVKLGARAALYVPEPEPEAVALDAKPSKVKALLALLPKALTAPATDDFVPEVL